MTTVMSVHRDQQRDSPPHKIKMQMPRYARHDKQKRAFKS